MQHIGSNKIEEYHQLRRAEKHVEANDLRDSIFHKNLIEKESIFKEFVKYEFTNSHKTKDKRNFEEYDIIKILLLADNHLKDDPYGEYIDNEK